MRAAMMMNEAPSAHDAQMQVFHDLLHIAEHPPVGSGGHFMAMNDGSWFDPMTWEGGIVPDVADAFVIIPEGVTVTYNGISSTPLAMVRVDGALVFVTDQDTQLVVDTLAVNEGGTLTIGTAAQPVAPGVKADIIFQDSAFIDRIDHTGGDIDNDPTQLSLGLISHGTVSIHGAEKTSHLKVATDPMAGQNTLTLATAPTGWAVGDKILVTGTHYFGGGAAGAPNPTDVAGTFLTEDEEFTILSIVGNVVTLSGRLAFNHDTPHPDFKASIANLTRNVEFRSANPDELAARGHTMFMHTSEVEIHNAAFTDLGRTDKSRDVDDYLLAGDGTGEDFRLRPDGRQLYQKTDAADVENMRGRYALHLHQTGTEVGSKAVILEGNVVSGTPGWGIVQHDSNAVLRENVAYANFGAGIVTETGNETGAWVRNLTVKTGGRAFDSADEGDIVLEKDQGRNQDFGVTGTGFWFQGRIVAALDNIAASSAGAGFFFLHRGVDDIETDSDTLQRPEIAYGEDSISSNQPAIEMFVGNENYASRVGLIIIGDETSRLHNDDRSMIEGFDAWEFGDHGIHIQYSAHYTLTNMRLFGTTGDARDLTFGIKLGTSLEDVVVHNTFISNVPIGIFTRDNFTDATQIAFWGAVDQNRVDRLRDYGHRYVNVEFDESVARDFDGRRKVPGSTSPFRPITKEVEDEDDLAGLSLTLTLDDPSLVTRWDSIGGIAMEGVWLEGTKTDTLGAIDFPAYHERIYISKEAIQNLLVEFGWFSVGTRKVLLVDTLYSDRLTGENDVVTHTIELIGEHWTMTPGARYLGELPDITSAEYFGLFFRGNNAPIRSTLENDIHFAAGLRDAGKEDVVMVRGTALHDELMGMAAGDLLLGNAGADMIAGQGGNDTLVAGEGGDTVEGGSGNDRLHGDDGFDVLIGGAGDDIATGDRGNDTLLGSEGADTLLGGEGNDLITGDDSTVVGGSDSLGGGEGEDTLDGAAAADTLSGDAGSDTLKGSTGNDILRGGMEADALFGGNGDDNLRGDEGDDILDGGAGNDVIDGGLGARDQASFASGTVGVAASLVAGLATGQGSDTLLGIERLLGSRAADQLSGDALNNVLEGSDGDDWLHGGDGNDLLDGGSGFDVASYAAAAAAVVATLENQGTQVGTRAAGMDTLGGIEALEGSGFNDTLSGNVDANRLAGGAGNDRLIGQGGQDTLEGGAGYDTAIFGGGTGLAFVQNADGTGSFGTAGVLRDIEDVVGTNGGDRFTSDAGAHVFEGEGGDDTVVSGGGADTLDGGEGTDTLSFVGAAGSVSASLGARVASIAGRAGTAQITGFEVLLGSDFGDQLSGGSGAETIRGGLGNDVLGGGGGDDHLLGEAGDDVLNGNDGSDTLDGGEGFDRVVFSGSTGLVLSLEATGPQQTGIGPTVLRSIEAIGGTSRDDSLTGSAEANELDGSGGNDTLVGGGGIDTLLGGSGTDLVQGGTGDDQLAGGDGDDTLDGGDGADLIDGGEGTRDVASFASATAGVVASLLTGRAGADTLAGIEILEGSEFDDTLSGRDGVDTLRGAGGNDVLEGGAGNDVLDGGAGIDTASYVGASAGVDVSLATVTGQNTRGAGTDALSGFEVLVGSAYDDTLAGNAGANTLRGGAGNDTLDGNGGADLLDGGTGFDVVRLGGSTALVGMLAASATIGGAALTNVEGIVAGSGNDQLSSDAGAHQLDGGAGDDTLAGGLGDDTLIGGDGFDTASYAAALAGVVVSLANRDPQATGVGSDVLSGIEALLGSAFNDTLAGGSANDTLRGGLGLDSLSGAGGNDRLEGNEGNDWLHAGTGADSVIGGLGLDTLSFAGLTSGVTVSLALAGQAQLLAGIGSIALEGIEALVGTSRNDRFTGDATGNTLDGGAGDDTLEGGAGSDALLGGDGNDTATWGNALAAVNASLLTGMANSAGIVDTLVGIEALEGSSFDDVLAGKDGADTLRGGAGNDLLRQSAGNDLLDGGIGTDVASYADAVAGVAINLALTGAQNTRGSGTDTLLSIENVEGSAHADTLTGSAAAETLRGGAGDDTLDGGAGADRLDGGLGRDIVAYTAATGAVSVTLRADFTGNASGAAGLDTILGVEGAVGSTHADTLTSDGGGHWLAGGAGNDTLNGGAGDDTLAGDDGIDTAFYAGATAAVTVNLADRAAQNTGGAGVDVLSGIEVVIGSGFNDSLAGDNAANTLRGGAGADTLVGAGGNDSLEGGDGNDLLVGAADGTDTLWGGAGFDLASFAGAAVGVNVTVANGAQTIATGRVVQLAEIEGLVGSSRDDTLTGSAADNALTGGSGNDWLLGAGGNDTIEGGGGADTLEGGSGMDLFVFGTSSGLDEVRDFVSGDRLSFRDFGGALDSFAEIFATARQVGADTRLALANPEGGTTTVLLKNFSLLNLDASDFLFA